MPIYFLTRSCSVPSPTKRPFSTNYDEITMIKKITQMIDKSNIDTLTVVIMNMYLRHRKKAPNVIGK